MVHVRGKHFAGDTTSVCFFFMAVSDGPPPRRGARVNVIFHPVELLEGSSDGGGGRKGWREGGKGGREGRKEPFDSVGGAAAIARFLGVVLRVGRADALPCIFSFVFSSLSLPFVFSRFFSFLSLVRTRTARRFA